MTAGTSCSTDKEHKVKQDGLDLFALVVASGGMIQLAEIFLIIPLFVREI